MQLRITRTAFIEGSRHSKPQGIPNYDVNNSIVRCERLSWSHATMRTIQGARKAPRYPGPKAQSKTFSPYDEKVQIWEHAGQVPVLKAQHGFENGDQGIMRAPVWLAPCQCHKREVTQDKRLTYANRCEHHRRVKPVIVVGGRTEGESGNYIGGLRTACAKLDVRAGRLDQRHQNSKEPGELTPE